MRIGVLFLVSFFLCSCAIAPLSQGGPARPVGEGQWEGGMQWSGYQNDRSNYVLVPIARVRYGLSPRWNLAAYTEASTLTLAAQNAYFVGDPFSAGVELGAVYAGGALSYFLGHSLSGLWGAWEPFFNAQFFLANATPGAWDSRYFNSAPALHPVFFVLALGSRYWVTESLALGLHATALISTRSISFQAPFVQNVSLLFKW